MAEHLSGGVYINVYGKNGSGKTSFSCTFPKPLLLLGLEDGTKSVRNVEGVDFLHAENTAEFASVAVELRGKHRGRYKTVVIDTCTSLQDMVLKEIKGWDEIPAQLGWGVADRQDYMARAAKTKELLRKFVDLKKVDHELNIVFLAQEKDHTKRGDDDVAQSYETDALQPFIASNLGDSTCKWLHDNVDFICQTFVRKQVILKEMSAGVGDNVKTVAIKQKTDKNEFCLRTERGHEIYAAKVRCDRNSKLPDVIVDPTFEKLAKYL